MNVRGVAALPTVARLLLLVALMGGIVTMHAVTFTLGHDHGAQPAMAATSQHHTTGGHAAPASPPCDGDDCGQQHTGLHGCVFVMTAVAIVAGLAMLCWIGTRNAVLVAPKTRRGHRRRQRAPPWTVLTLHQLSILRV
ncbi:DUF6153 family protein [Mycobacterium antarcticum]|uniref:DUF6153 family protein n=1 Tax=unclassified Mycolicibacterium TaxID=2636767 RepID=UPI0024E068BC|nr:MULTISPECIES: DUF6153 family protein [unclassified Mycolicibacterium]